MSTRIADLITATRRRIRVAWCAHTLALALPFVLGAVAVVAAFAWLLRNPLPGWVLLVMPVMCVVSVVGWSRTQRWSDTDVARTIELRTGHDGALISALEFTDSDNDWHQEVHRRADRVLDDPATRSCVPIRFDATRTLAAAAAAVLAVGLGLFAPLGSAGAASTIAPEVAAEAEALEELAEILEESDDDEDEADEALEELADELRRLAQELRRAETPLEAAEQLEREAETLRDEAGNDLLADKAAIHGLEQQLAVAPLAPGSDAAAQLEALASLIDELGDAEREALIERLERLAQAQSTGNPGVAAQIQSAADALRAGDTSAASQALSAAAANQRTASSDLRSRQVASSAANAASASAGRLRNPNASPGDGNGSGDGDGDGSGEGDGDGGGSGDGDGSGEGSGDGSGSGEGSGQGGSGQGSPGSGAAGDVAGASPTGGQSQGQGGQGTPGQGTNGEGIGSPEQAEIFSPVDAGESDEVGVDISGGVGQGEIVGRGDSSTTEGQAFVPFQEVLPSYLDSAATALDELDLPADLRSTVRDYFDQIAQS